MLESPEQKKLCRYSNYGYLNFKDCSKVRSADPPISFYFLYFLYFINFMSENSCQ